MKWINIRTQMPLEDQDVLAVNNRRDFLIGKCFIENEVYTCGNDFQELASRNARDWERDVFNESKNPIFEFLAGKLFYQRCKLIRRKSKDFPYRVTCIIQSIQAIHQSGHTVIIINAI